MAAATQALGGTTVLMERFDAEEALRAIEIYGVTHTQWVPTMFKRLLTLPPDVRDRYDLSSHRLALHGAAPCPVDLKRGIIEWWGPIVREYYGATEGNGMTVIDSTEWLAHVGSVGRPVFGAIHICGDDGAELPTGEDGLVYFERDVQPFAYHKDEAKTSSTRHPEHPTWTTLGDVGHLDDEGYLYLTDRQEFLIISGGVNIYPAESELLLLSHPSVADVAVIGVPNAEFGEEVKAIVELPPGVAATAEQEAELIDFCRSRLAHFKCPRSVDFVDQLPRLETGKLAKKALRDEYRQLAVAGGWTPDGG
jgi:fatty-acyl-CoA synthase